MAHQPIVGVLEGARAGIPDLVENPIAASDANECAHGILDLEMAIEILPRFLAWLQAKHLGAERVVFAPSLFYGIGKTEERFERAH